MSSSVARRTRYFDKLTRLSLGGSPTISRHKSHCFLLDVKGLVLYLADA